MYVCDDLIVFCVYLTSSLCVFVCDDLIVFCVYLTSSLCVYVCDDLIVFCVYLTSSLCLYVCDDLIVFCVYLTSSLCVYVCDDLIVFCVYLTSSLCLYVCDDLIVFYVYSTSSHSVCISLHVCSRSPPCTPRMLVSLKDQLVLSMRDVVKEEVSMAMKEHTSRLTDSMFSCLRSGAGTPVPSASAGSQISVQAQQEQIRSLISRKRLNEAFQTVSSLLFGSVLCLEGWTADDLTSWTLRYLEQ